jgi:hypothetical protein
VSFTPALHVFCSARAGSPPASQPLTAVYVRTVACCFGVVSTVCCGGSGSFSFENSGPNHSNALWWEVMQSFSHEQRSQVLKFVTGRSRLPVAFKVEWQPDSDRLPRAATCFQKIYLPRYPSFAKMRERMIVAIQCMSIDTD